MLESKVTMTSHIPSNGEMISSGQHAEELQTYLAGARPDQTFTPLMVDAGILPEDLRGARMIPGVTYGIDAVRPAHFSVAEVVPGTENLLEDHLATPRFNPHLSLRARAHGLVEGLESGKGKDRVRGNTFGLPSYVLEGRSGRHLFVGGAESDQELIPHELAEKVSEAYDIGTIVVGNDVVVGEVDIDVGRSSLPTLVREIGTNIVDFDVSHAEKLKILRNVRESHSQQKSPDYRPYLETRKHKPPRRG
jgi:hypothetical protein